MYILSVITILIFYFYFAVVVSILEFIPFLLFYNYSLFLYHAPQHLQPPALTTLCPIPALSAAWGGGGVQIRGIFLFFNF